MVEHIVRVCHAHARRIRRSGRRIIFFIRQIRAYIRQQSGCRAVLIGLRDRTSVIVPRLTRQTVGLVVDVLCTLDERAVVILAAPDEALCTPDDIFPPGYCFFRAEVCCQFSFHSVGIIWYKFKYNF